MRPWLQTHWNPPPSTPGDDIAGGSPNDPNTPVQLQLLQTWRLQFENNGFCKLANGMENIHGVDVSWMHKPRGEARMASCRMTSYLVLQYLLHMVTATIRRDGG
jgi:hypothetical protein